MSAAPAKPERRGRASHLDNRPHRLGTARATRQSAKGSLGPRMGRPGAHDLEQAVSWDGLAAGMLGLGKTPGPRRRKSPPDYGPIPPIDGVVVCVDEDCATVAYEDDDPDRPRRRYGMVCKPCRRARRGA